MRQHSQSETAIEVTWSKPALPSGTAKLHTYFGIPLRTEWIEGFIEERLGQGSDLRQVFSYGCGRSRLASAAAPIELLRFGLAEDVVRFS